MRHIEFKLRAKDGVKLHARRWEPEQEPIGVVCLIHGVGEHSGRYFSMAHHLAGRGYALLAIDLRGHGKSEGKRGHISNYAALMDDVTILLNEGSRSYPQRPFFLYGQSMGGNLVINHALRRHPLLRGVIASSPMLRTVFEPPSWKKLLARYIGRLLPAMPLTNEVKARDLSRDEEIIRKYKTDPLVHDRLTLRFYKVLQAGTWAIEHAAELSMPMLIMHGDSDRITSLQASRTFAERAGDSCTLKVWEGYYHEVHNEPGKEQVLDYVAGWLASRS
ncbi:MAG: lysophospholipase [Candidatus Eisenbacteria bacterium]|nr:lysophospholipase [Candidatus Eisenbacteria bacterium]